MVYLHGYDRLTLFCSSKLDQCHSYNLMNTGWFIEHMSMAEVKFAALRRLHLKQNYDLEWAVQTMDSELESLPWFGIRCLYDWLIGRYTWIAESRFWSIALVCFEDESYQYTRVGCSRSVYLPSALSAICVNVSNFLCRGKIEAKEPLFYDNWYELNYLSNICVYIIFVHHFIILLWTLCKITYILKRDVCYPPDWFVSREFNSDPIFKYFRQSDARHRERSLANFQQRRNRLYESRYSRRWNSM